MNDIPDDFWDRVAREVAKLMVAGASAAKENKLAQSHVDSSIISQQINKLSALESALAQRIAGGYSVFDDPLSLAKQKFAPMNKDAA